MAKKKMARLIKCNELESGSKEIIEVPSDAIVSLNSVTFKEGMISKVVFEKDNHDTSLNLMFVRLYAGDTLIAVNSETEGDYVVKISVVEISEDDDIPFYWIRKAEKYDY